MFVPHQAESSPIDQPFINGGLDAGRWCRLFEIPNSWSADKIGAATTAGGSLDPSCGIADYFT